MNEFTEHPVDNFGLVNKATLNGVSINITIKYA